MGTLILDRVRLCGAGMPATNEGLRTWELNVEVEPDETETDGAAGAGNSVVGWNSPGSCGPRAPALQAFRRGPAGCRARGTRTKHLPEGARTTQARSPEPRSPGTNAREA